MNKKILLLLVLFFSICVYAGDTVRVKNLTNNPVNRFTFNLFRSIKSDDVKQNNFVISPMSVSFLLGMLNDGAGGETRAEISNLLGCNVETFDSLTRATLLNVKSNDDSTNMSISNCMILNDKCRLNNSYQDKIENTYSALVKNMDFKAPNTLNEINDWCCKKTDGMIPTAIDYIIPDAYAYLLNTVYFNGKWRVQFDKKNTKSEKFIKFDGKSVRMKIMHAKREYKYYKNKIYSTIVMDYHDRKFQMMILLPNKRKRINDILKNMDEHQWNVIADKMNEKDLDVKLPVFTIETNVMLNPVLMNLGLSSAFSLEKADFKNMSCDPLCISSMIHKTKIEVNEQGTKAVSMTETCWLKATKGHFKRHQYKKFYATHPFIFAIKEKGSNTILFIGEFDGTGY